MTKLDALDEHGRCKNCRSRSKTYSTVRKSDKWLWKKLCASCDNELERQTLELS